MHASVCPHRRMRYSLESRAQIVALILAGKSPQARCRLRRLARDRYRLWRRYREASPRTSALDRRQGACAASAARGFRGWTIPEWSRQLDPR
jgi:hypothetical protein